MPVQLYVGGRVELKKQHPCGCYVWEVLRSGADFKIRCEKCGHLIMIARPKLEKSIKKILNKGVEEDVQNFTC